MDNLLGRQLNYSVHTPVYEGPLDLLLNLIEHAELDITSVSLAMVTDQYLVYINGLAQVNADEISAFLVIAAKLLQIKSEALLPRPPTREPGEEDMGRSLVDQLKLYKRFKEIGVWLYAQQQANLRTYLRVAPHRRLNQSSICRILHWRNLSAQPGRHLRKNKKNSRWAWSLLHPG